MEEEDDGIVQDFDGKCGENIHVGGNEENLQERKESVKEILNMEISWDQKSLKIMRLLDSWDILWALADFILAALPPLPAQLANEWKAPELVQLNRYKEYRIPLDVGERSIRRTSANGNCIFNALSIAIYGDEKMAITLKLGSVLSAVEDIVSFSKYLSDEYADNLQRWLSSFAFEVKSAEEVELACRRELENIIQHPYRDGTLFHLHLAANFVLRPIHQHCIKESDVYLQYRQVIYPFKANFQPTPIHLVWIPSKPKSRHSSFNHVVPAVCSIGPYGSHIEECAFQGLGTCMFLENFNMDEDEKWVECTLCNQWVHQQCMGVTRDYSEYDDFPCGCDSLVDGKVRLKSKTWYNSLKVEDVDIDFEVLIRETDARPCSIRSFLFRRQGHQSLKLDLRVGRFGPFTDDFVTELLLHMRSFVDKTREALLPDLYLPEVLLRIVMKRERVSRLVAELCLLQHSTTT